MKYKINNERVESDNKFMDFFFKVSRLKSLYRQGWLKNGVTEEKCESVADHSFATAMIGWVLCREMFPQLDDSKVLKLAVIHEMGEVFAGDITPHDGVSEQDKFAIEEEAVKKVFSNIDDKDYFIGLWREFEEQKSPEAVFVKQLDKLEMALQAKKYQDSVSMNPDDFIESAKKAIKESTLLDIIT